MDTTRLNLVVSANFTAEPVDDALRFWLDRLLLPAEIQHAPFDQVFQQLLDPASVLRRQPGSIGLLMIRAQQWLEADRTGNRRDRPIIEDFANAARTALDHSAAQLVVCFCPPTGLDAEGEAAVARLEQQASEALSGIGGVRILTSHSILETYPLESIADAHGQRLADIPYTPVFFSVLGTVLARCLHAVLVPAHKVLVLDCDDTLWDGLCSELGPLGVRLTDGRLALQRFAVEQRNHGTLVCLASRNNEADVFAVFEQNRQMILAQDDLTATRINWGLKSDNLAELADRLGLSLGSFVFLDDDPVQCAEVRERFPEVVAIPVPEQGATTFCRHIWPLDTRADTQEGRRRTMAYREHVSRENVRESSTSFQQFLDSLELRVDISPLGEPDLARATELTHRTSQFNLTGRRFSEAEFNSLLKHPDTPCFAVRVRDRFGDYGLVGLMIAEPDGDTARVPLMLLSCRSLGRGVEYRMVAHLGQWAREAGLSRIALHCQPTERNTPAQEFLHRLGDVSQHENNSLNLLLDATAAADAQLALDDAPQSPSSATAAAHQHHDNREATASRRATFLASIPSTLADAAAIHDAVRLHAGAPLHDGNAPDAGTATDDVVALLTAAFAEQLGIDEIAEDIGFFELGGHSLQAMQVLSNVSGALGVELDPTLLFTTGFTVAELAEEIGYLRQDASESAAASSTSPGH